MSEFEEPPKVFQLYTFFTVDVWQHRGEATNPTPTPITFMAVILLIQPSTKQHRVYCQKGCRISNSGREIHITRTTSWPNSSTIPDFTGDRKR